MNTSFSSLILSSFLASKFGLGGSLFYALWNELGNKNDILRKMSVVRFVDLLVLGVGMVYLTRIIRFHE